MSDLNTILNNLDRAGFRVRPMKPTILKFTGVTNEQIKSSETRSKGKPAGKDHNKRGGWSWKNLLRLRLPASTI